MTLIDLSLHLFVLGVSLWVFSLWLADSKNTDIATCGRFGRIVAAIVCGVAFALRLWVMLRAFF